MRVSGELRSYLCCFGSGFGVGLVVVGGGAEEDYKTSWVSCPDLKGGNTCGSESLYKLLCTQINYTHNIHISIMWKLY